MTFGVLSSQANLTVPTRNYSEANAEYLLAPLWFPNISTSLVESTVSWEVEELTEPQSDDGGSGSGSGDNEESLLKFAEETVDVYTTRNFGAPSDFSPTWAIIVNWNVIVVPDYYEQYYRCVVFYECLCESYYEDFSGSGSNVSGNSSCPTEECFEQNGWSYNDIFYLNLTCRNYIYDVMVSCFSFSVFSSYAYIIASSLPHSYLY